MAETVEGEEGVALHGFVAGGVAIANAGDLRFALDLELETVHGTRDEAALVIRNRDGDVGEVPAVGFDFLAVGVDEQL